MQGTSQFTFGAGEFASTVGPNPQTEPSTSGNVLTWTVPNDPSCSSPDPVSLSFRAEAGPDLGTFSSSASVTNGANTSTILDQAPVTTTENFESNNAPGTATNVTPDHLYTDTISSGQDMDYFSVPVTSGDVGKMVRISLSHVPSGADFDMVLYGAASDSTLRGAPVNHGPVNHGPVNHGPLGDDAECLPPGTVLDPQTLQDVPQLNTGTYSIRSYSTNRGTGSEFACAIVQPGDVGHGLLVQVSSYLDTSSAQAALLQVSESAPVTPLPCLGVPSTDTSKATELLPKVKDKMGSMSLPIGRIGLSYYTNVVFQRENLAESGAEIA